MSGCISRFCVASNTHLLTPETRTRCFVCIDNFNVTIATAIMQQLVRVEMFSHPFGALYGMGKDQITQLPLYSSSHEKINFLTGNGKDILVPDSMFPDTDIETIYKYSFGSVPRLKILYDAIPEAGMRLIYAVPETLTQQLDEIFPGNTLMNRKTLLLQKLLHLNNSGQRIYTHTRADSFDVFVFDDRGFVAQNTFYYTFAKDYLFFLMRMVKQYALDAGTLKLSLSGEIDKQGAIYTLLHKYIRHIEFMPFAPEGLKWPEDVPPHVFYNLPETL